MKQHWTSASKLCQRTTFPDMGLADNNLRTDAFSHSAPVYCVGPNFFQTHFFEANMDYIFFQTKWVRAYFFSRIDTHDLLYLGGLQSGCPARHRPVIGATTRRAYETEISAGKGSWSASHRAF